LFPAFPAHSLVPNFVKAEAVVAHPFAAVGAKVKVHKGFQIGLFKGDTVFVCPEHLPGFLMLYGQAAGLKRHGGGFPFLAATVAEKAENEGFFVRPVGCLFGQRFTHIFRLSAKGTKYPETNSLPKQNNSSLRASYFDFDDYIWAVY
jgi:hypothetical protein